MQYFQEKEKPPNPLMIEGAGGVDAPKALFYAQKGDFMNREPFETMHDVMDAKQIAKALQISKAGAYNLLNSPDFPTLRIGGRKLVMKNDLLEWLKSHTNRQT